MPLLKNIKVEQTSPVTWDVWIDGIKQEGICELNLNIKANEIPTVQIKYRAYTADIETDIVEEENNE